MRVKCSMPSLSLDRIWAGFEDSFVSGLFRVRISSPLHSVVSIRLSAASKRSGANPGVFAEPR